MPRFKAEHSGSDLLVVDQANGDNPVLSMPWADLHSNGSGATATVSIGEPIQIERPFGTPYGTQLEMGFDIEFTVTNSSGSDRQIGLFRLKGFNLATQIQLLAALGDSFPLIPNGQNHAYYPGDRYSPLVVMRDYIGGDYPYNLSIALCYPAVEYDHPLYMQWPTSAEGAVPSEVKFACGFGTGPDTWATMPTGTTRRYRLCFRINDQTQTDIGPAIDAPQEWLWTLRGYQQYFRALYGRPDYRRMGGWDGRVIGSFNTNPNGTYNATTNPRTFGPNSLDNPSTVGTGGAPDGYLKFRNTVLAFRSLNLHRVIAWSFAGYEGSPSAPNPVVAYDPRIGTGVDSMGTEIGPTGPSTVRAAVQQSRDAVQFGLWWGESCKVSESDTWSDGSRHDFDSTNASDRATMLRETDIVIQKWHAQVIGLDAYLLALRFPGRSVEWLRFLQQRYPRVLFITEAGLPDFLHVIAPTYRTEPSFGSVQSAAWLVQYVNPGSEYIMQTVSGLDQPETVDRFCRFGYTAIGGWSESFDDPELLTRALPRWRELGERAVPGYDSHQTRDLVSADQLENP